MSTDSFVYVYARKSLDGNLHRLTAAPEGRLKECCTKEALDNFHAMHFTHCLKPAFIMIPGGKL